MKRYVLTILLVIFTFVFMPSCGGGGGGGEGSLEINSFNVFSKYGYWAAKGTITNNSSDRKLFVRINVNLFNKAGTVIDSDYSYVKTSDASLKVGQTAAFELWCYGTNPSAVARYKYWLTSR
ncbi:MAG: FxLYD domain-containing protein [Proteobacteria bacterium]|nr:FxLYD domain-containing protein [Pseudomonadota bacterium]